MSLRANSIVWASVRYFSASYETGASRVTKCSSISSGSAISSRAISGAVPFEHPDQLFVFLGDVVSGTNKDHQADERRSSSKPEPPVPPRGIGLGDNRGNARQHRHLREGPELIQRVKGSIAMFDQPDHSSG